MNLVDIKNKVENMPTVMNTLAEYDLLDNVSALGLSEIEVNEDLFIEIIDKIIYSYRENYLDNKNNRNEKYLTWTVKLKKIQNLMKSEFV